MGHILGYRQATEARRGDAAPIAILCDLNLRNQDLEPAPRRSVPTGTHLGPGGGRAMRAHPMIPALLAAVTACSGPSQSASEAPYDSEQASTALIAALEAWKKAPPPGVILPFPVRPEVVSSTKRTIGLRVHEKNERGEKGRTNWDRTRTCGLPRLSVRPLSPLPLLR
jgi:hypothetical protein